MIIKMIAADAARAPSVIHHLDATYRQGSDGSYDIGEAHVNDMRPFGLITRAEADAAAAAAAKTPSLSARLDAVEARLDAVEARLDALEIKKKP